MKAAIRQVGNWKFTFPSEEQNPPERQTVVVCRQLTQAERMLAWDNLNWTARDAQGGVTLLPRTFRLARELCLLAIESIENFPEGAPKPYPTNGTDEEKSAYLDQFPDLELLKIGQAIRNRATLEEEVKN